MHFQSVTFDLDGTLLDTICDLAEACRVMLEEVGEPPRTLAEVRSFVGKGMAVLVERCLTREERPTTKKLHQGIESFKHHYAAVNGRFAQVYPGVIEGLKAWKDSGTKMGVVTNKPGMFTKDLLDTMQMTEYFDVIVSGDSTAQKKPHPEPILYACRILGVRPDRNLHIGDSKNDIDAAHAAGCVAYAVPYGYNEGEPLDSRDCDALVADILAALAVARAA